MQLSVTFRHMDSTDALREYAREKVERIRKYFPDPINAGTTTPPTS
jgi:putative sigma-54 modulation protein